MTQTELLKIDFAWVSPGPTLSTGTGTNPRGWIEQIKDPKGCVVLLGNPISSIVNKTYLIIVDSLLWHVVWNDQTEPDDEDDAQADGGDSQPAWCPHAVVDARCHIRPAPKKRKYP